MKRTRKGYVSKCFKNATSIFIYNRFLCQIDSTLIIEYWYKKFLGVPFYFLTYIMRLYCICYGLFSEPVKAVLSIKKSLNYDKAWIITCESKGGRATDLKWYFNGRLLLSKDLKPLEQRFDGGTVLFCSFVSYRHNQRS